MGNSALPSIRSKVQDDNQAIQGLSNAAMLGALLYGQNAEKVKDEKPGDQEYDLGGSGSASDSCDGRVGNFRSYRSPN